MMVSVALAGCASSGNQSLKKESEASVKSKIVEGVTTKSDIKKTFGSASKTSFTDGGKEIWTYELADVSLDAVSYIPVVNWFGSSASGTKKELVIMFDGDKVQRYSMSESPVSTKTGVFK
uniref:Outer membrane protein assembly factor n=2 Tax=root TaxID=1 RepID=A0A8S5MGD1_9CAUD|nr:MAG TPA: outer membrane protein assembly factor [Siphoviridae sp. ctEpf2]